MAGQCDGHGDVTLCIGKLKAGLEAVETALKDLRMAIDSKVPRWVFILFIGFIVSVSGTLLTIQTNQTVRVLQEVDDKLDTIQMDVSKIDGKVNTLKWRADHELGELRLNPTRTNTRTYLNGETEL